VSILTRNDYFAAKKQRAVINRTASIAATAFQQTQNFHAAGNPGAGTLAGTSVAAGIIQTDALAGYPILRPFTGGAKGYVTRIEAYALVATDFLIADVLWKGGAYPFNAAQAVTSPTWAGRVPEGTDFLGLELWAEAVTAFTGVPAITVQYTDQDGNAGTTGSVAAPAALGIARQFQLPLASGDNGLRSITNVASGTATVGTFNLLVLRPIFRFRLAANESKIFTMAEIGMADIFEDSALVALPTPDSTATSTPYVAIEVANN
jgi:hypothetical protein